MSMSTRSIPGVFFKISSACRPSSARRTIDLPALQHAGQGEDVPHIVVHDQDLLAGEFQVGLRAGRRAARRRMEFGLDPVEEQGRLIDQMLQRPGVLDDGRLGHLLESVLLLPGEVPPRVDDDPEVLRVDVPLDRLQELEAVHVGQVQVEHHAVERPGPQGLEGLGGRPDGGDADVGVADRGGDVAALDLVVLHDQQLPDPALQETFDGGEGIVQRLLAHGLLEEGKRPQPDPALPAIVHRDHVDGDVAGGRVVLQAVQHDPAVHVGQEEVQGDRGRPDLPGNLEGRLPFRDDHALEAQLVGLVQEDGRRIGGRARRSG